MGKLDPGDLRFGRHPGGEVREAASAGGEARKGKFKVPPDQLREEVKEEMEKGKLVTNARRRVANRHGISRRTVRRHVPTESIREEK